MLMKENTPAVIISIIDFTVELEGDDNIQKKLDLVDQFRIHFKMIPEQRPRQRKYSQESGSLQIFLTQFYGCPNDARTPK